MATTTPIETQVKLGRLPVRTDARTLALPRYVDRAKLPPPPPDLDLAAAVMEWPMYANDRIGDCTTAAAAHMIEAWTYGRGRHPRRQRPRGPRRRSRARPSSRRG